MANVTFIPTDIPSFLLVLPWLAAFGASDENRANYGQIRNQRFSPGRSSSIGLFILMPAGQRLA
jgi:hypothetical protein